MKNKLYKKAWEQFGVEKQLIVAMEECAELIKELSKAIRGNPDGMKIAEEIADVEIMTEQIKQHFALQSVVDAFKVAKQKRLEERLKDGENNQLKENKDCPSYDTEYCETYPTPYGVRCKDIENCVWKNYDFKNAKGIQNDKCRTSKGKNGSKQNQIASCGNRKSNQQSN